MLDGFSEGLTRLRLAPNEFVGSVPCRRGTPGALQTYVARIQEVAITGADAGFTTSYTSGPVPCDQAVIIPATPTRFYAAEILGFDDGAAGGDYDAASARWSASCGRGSGVLGDAGLDPYRPTIALRGVTVSMRGCTSFFGGAPGGSQLVVDQIGALGARRCGQGAGEVAAFRATLDGVSRTAACGSPLVFDVPGVERYHTIQLTGFEGSGDAGSAGADGGPASDAAAPPVGAPGAAPSDAGADAGDPLDASVAPPAPLDGGGTPDAAPPPLVLGEPRWRTQCIGRSLPGIAAPAYCDPLVPLP